MSRPIVLQDYQFLPPPGWDRQDFPDRIELRSPQSGCLIMIFQPQPSNGELQQDALNAFDLMYPPESWQRRNAGEAAFTLSRGSTQQGLGYAMVDAEMATTGPAGFHPERGVAWTIAAGDLVVLIAARHNDFFVSHEPCYGRYDHWPRFFDSFAISDIASAPAAPMDHQREIVGLWSMQESGVAFADYRFAEDGRYSRGGALGSTTVSRDDRFETTTFTSRSIEGGGRYSVAGACLVLEEAGGEREEIRFRIDEVNEGGTGWKKRLVLLKSDSGGLYEVKYLRQPET